MKKRIAVGAMVVLGLLSVYGRSQDEALRVRGFDTAEEPRDQTRLALVDEYVRLSTVLANQLTDEELQAGIDGMKRQLDDHDAVQRLNEIRATLQELIDAHPESQAAAQARRALEILDAGSSGDFPTRATVPFFGGEGRNK